MSELVITAAGFNLQPIVVGLPDGPAVLRWAYTRSFLASDSIQVQWGTMTSGFGVEVPCSIASGLITVDQDSTLWTTDNSQDPSPLSIGISAWLLTSRRKLIQQLQIAGKTQWVVPSSLAPSTSWAEFSNYNQAVSLYYYNPSFYNAPETDRQIRLFSETNYASDTHLGAVFTSVEPAMADSPVAWITDDPLVRDAIKIQGTDVDETLPSDGQALIYNAANEQYEPGNVGPGTGNVISNEVSSVDGELVEFSGTGGKTIKRSVLTGLIKAVSGVVSAAVAAVDYVAPGLITASGLTQATARLLGRTTASSGAVEEITVGTGLQLAAGVLSNTVTDTGITQLTGDVTAGPGSGSQVATIPASSIDYAQIQQVSAVSTLLGRGDSGAPGNVQEITLGGGLSMTGTTLAASGSGGYDTVEDEGTPLTQRSTINFEGAGVSAADTGGVTVVTIPGGGGSTSFAAIDKFNYN